MEMLTRILMGYFKNCFTENYIFSVTVDGMKMACFCTECKFLSSLVYYDKDRKAVRFRPNKKQRQMILASAEKIIPICTVEYFDSMVKSKWKNKHGKMVTYNRGEIAEKLITELIFKQKWEKDNVNWWSGADVIDSNGKAWSLKDENNATICHYQQMLDNKWVV